jgi:hypothetical protein
MDSSNLEMNMRFFGVLAIVVFVIFAALNAFGTPN